MTIKSSDFSHQFQLAAFYFDLSVEKLLDANRLVFHLKNPYCCSTKDQASIQIAIHLHFDLEPLNLTHIYIYTHASVFFSPHLQFIINFCVFLTLACDFFYIYTDTHTHTSEKFFCSFVCLCASFLSACVYSRFYLIMALWRLKQQQQSKNVVVKLSFFFADIASAAHAQANIRTQTIDIHLFIQQTTFTLNLCVVVFVYSINFRWSKKENTYERLIRLKTKMPNVFIFVYRWLKVTTF